MVTEIVVSDCSKPFRYIWYYPDGFLSILPIILSALMILLGIS